MGAAAAIRWLTRRFAEIARNQRQIEGVKKRAMMQQERAFALLSVAGELAAGEDEIADAGLLGGGRSLRQRLPDAAEDEAIGRTDVVQGRIALVAEDER